MIPLNVSPGYASTVNLASSPACTFPTSASSTLARICIFVRSFAIRNRVGAWKAAATVWPTSTLRNTTMPSIGLAILVNARFVAAMSRSAFACSTDAFAADNAAAFWSPLATAVSSSACEISPCCRSSRCRKAMRTESLYATWAFSTLAFAEARDASAFSSWAWNRRGSRLARSCAFFTTLLKSTYSRSTIPEICEPTFTVMMAETSPVAFTTSLTGPRVTASVR